MIYTFYSYKGGVGRTHLLANLAAYLCHYRKRKVLLIDWDLEAPGLHFYFKQTNEEVTSEGLIDLCEYYVEQLQQATEKEPLGAEDLIFPTEENGYITNMLRNENGGKIDLLPATRYEKGYHTHINNFDWLDFYDNQKGNIYLGWLKDELKKRSHYDYVFIDSRTGQNDYSGICNVMMPDMNIFVIAPNTQNFIGAKEMADRIIGSNYVKQGNRKPYILPVLSKIDDFFGERADEWKEKFTEDFSFVVPIFEEELKSMNNQIMDIILSRISLNYNGQFAMGEKVYFKKSAKKLRESSYLKKFENIALDFLEEMNENNEVSISKIVGEKMIPEYMKKIENNPQNADNYSELGYVCGILGFYEKAKEYCLGAIKIKPNNAATWNNLGTTYGKLQDYPQAIEAYQKAIIIDPDFYDVWNNLGFVYVNLQNYPQAVEAYQKAIAVNPNYYQAWYNLGVVYGDLQDYPQATEAYQKALAIEPDKHDVWNNLGNVYDNLQNYYQAIDAHEKAIALKPDFHEAWYNLGNVHGNLQNYHQAIDAYEKAIALKPDFHEAWDNLGYVYLKQQNYKKAQEYFEKAIAINPKHDNAIFNLACLYSLQQNKVQALAYLQQAIELNPEWKAKAPKDKDIEWLWQDADFQALVGE